MSQSYNVKQKPAAGAERGKRQSAKSQFKVTLVAIG